MLNHFTPEEYDNQDDNWQETSSGAGKLLLLSLAMARLAQHHQSIQEYPSPSASLEPAVEHLQRYCLQQRQSATQSHQRKAYDFLITHITEMRPDTQELHATLDAWARLRQSQAQKRRSTGCAPCTGRRTRSCRPDL